MYTLRRKEEEWSPMHRCGKGRGKGPFPAERRFVLLETQGAEHRFLWKAD